MMKRSTLALAVTLAAALALGGCTSSRFAGGPVASARAATPAPEPEPIEAVPSGPMSSEPLPPLAGDPAIAGGTEVAALPPAAAPAPAPTPSPAGRSQLVGGWTASTGAGASCRVQLSSSPALDLYRASATGCGGDLARVNAWDFRDGEVYLYQQGGTVAARLRGGSGGLSGVIAKSGAPLTLAR
jgi:predicted small secreted protein